MASLGRIITCLLELHNRRLPYFKQLLHQLVSTIKSQATTTRGSSSTNASHSRYLQAPTSSTIATMPALNKTQEDDSPTMSSTLLKYSINSLCDDSQSSISITKPPMTIVYRDNAEQVLQEQIVINPDAPSATKTQLLHICESICPFMLADKETSVRPLTGGLSNELFVVRNHKHAVLVRIHPNVTTEIVSRQQEHLLVAWLSKHNRAPAYHGRFINGRVEEMYLDHSPLSYRDMPEYAPDIAVLIARLHALDCPSSILEDTKSASGHWRERLGYWIKMAQTVVSTESTVPESSNQQIDMLLRDIYDKKEWLESVWDTRHNNGSSNNNNNNVQSEAYQFLSEIALTHMDAQSLNFLRPSSGRPLKLIDFEYAGRNPRALDFANTFGEFCDMNNIKADFVNEYPSEKVQDSFLRAYCQELVKNCLENDDTIDINPFVMQLDFGNVDDVTTKQFLAAMREEIGRYTLWSHLGWAIWSVCQHRLSNIDFDYLKYAQHRLDGFEYFQTRFWK